nr:MAG TPA: hypothetical protein [Caudoviricetes sp.]
MFAIEWLVILSPIVQIRYTFPSTFRTPIHNPYTFGIANGRLLHHRYSLIRQVTA